MVADYYEDSSWLVPLFLVIASDGSELLRINAFKGGYNSQDLDAFFTWLPANVAEEIIVDKEDLTKLLAKGIRGLSQRPPE